MIRRLAIAFTVIGLGIAAYFVHRGPTLVAEARALTFTRMTPDAGELSVEATHFGVDFITLRDVDVPVLRTGALRRGDEWALLDELNWFESYVAVDGGLYVIGENSTEGGGPTLELIATRDLGQTWVHVASLPKPVYYAMFRALRVEGETLRVTIEVDPDEGLAELPDEWVLPPFRVEPLTRLRPGTGPFVELISKNGGRTWLMDRDAQSPEP